MTTGASTSGATSGAARRPGRVQRIAHDATPLATSTPDVEARIGWLLAMSRLHHPDPAYADGARFLQALADAGVSASRSLLSRWESAEIPISYEAMTGYERALGLEVGRISSVTGYVRTSIPGVRVRVARPKLDPATREFSIRMDELIDLAESGQALARDWQELGWYLSSVPLVHLRASAWQRLATQVVFTLPRTVKVAYRQYSTAVMNIACLERSHDFLTDAIAAYLAEPNVQVITNPIGLLDRLPTRGAARLVLDLVEQPHTETVFKMAVWLASQKLARGDFTEGERARLDMLVLTLWRANPEKAGDELAELIARLPDGMRSTLVSAAHRAGRRRLGYVVEHAEETPAAQAGAVAHAMAEAARARLPQQAPYGEDTMMTRLVREAVFHRDSERRHLAALVISASPFAEAVADELLELMDIRAGREQPQWLRVRAATLVRYLCGDRHRMRMLGFLEDPAGAVVTPLVQGLGHLRFDAVCDQVLRRSLRPVQDSQQDAKLYALGMTGSPALDAIVRSADAPDWQRDAARWWRAHGPAVLA